MNKLAAVFVSALIAASSYAVTPTAPASATAAASAPVPAQATNDQREKITMCNRSASGKTGDALKKYMKECTSKK